MTNLFSHGYALVGLLVSLATCIGIVITKPLHSRHSLDQSHGIQKVHSAPTPRIGGVGLAIGFLAVWLTFKGDAQALLGALGLAGIPVLLFGLAEDLTKSVGVSMRMFAAVCSGMLFPVITGTPIASVGLWWFDPLLTSTLFAIAFTAFAISTATNAINLIDGFHGLASGTILIMLAAVALVSYLVGDWMLFQVTLSLMAITLGFILVNFPRGLIFLGDGGAYFLGFLVAALTVVLPARNPEVSPWICPLILSYPLTETVISIARRLRGKGQHPGEADDQHLHHMIFRRYVNSGGPARTTNMNHVLTSVTLWVFPMVSLALVYLSDLQSHFAIRATVAVFFIYVITYKLASHSDKRRND